MSNMVLFEEQRVRRVLHQEKWHFVVSDVVQILTDTANVADYIKKLRKRDPSLAEGWGQIVTPLLVETSGGKQKLNCADAEGLLRIIQSIPSPKAEPFKRWLAHVGYERLQEIENPELAATRMRAIYQAKGYSDAWIEKRMRGIAVRDELTSEWKERGVKESVEYGILTAEISKATFGLTPTQYRTYKGLTKSGDNLRDHMTDLELIFTMLGEASTTEIARRRDAQDFDENKTAAVEGGTVAGSARKDLEHRTKRRVASRDNYLAIPEGEQRRRRALE